VPLRNGTVRDCSIGVSIAGSDNLVRNLTLIANGWYGLAIERGTANRIKASAARDGNTGFLIVGGNTLTSNTATGNDTGFYLNGWGDDPQALHVLIDNEATGNGYGVSGDVASVRIIQNRILRNGRDGIYFSGQAPSQTRLATRRSRRRYCDRKVSRPRG
jgi:Right handed beta helix region